MTTPLASLAATEGLIGLAAGGRALVRVVICGLEGRKETT
jgi:hypothetical protein